jgi:hypothetical protein
LTSFSHRKNLGLCVLLARSGPVARGGTQRTSIVENLNGNQTNADPPAKAIFGVARSYSSDVGAPVFAGDIIVADLGQSAAIDLRNLSVHGAAFRRFDRAAGWLGLPVRDAWAGSIKIAADCATKPNKTITNANCESDATRPLGRRSARPLAVLRFNGGAIERGLMDVMRGVFVREENGVDLDGNGLGNLLCEGVVTRNVQGSVNGVQDCKYPDGVLEEILKFREHNKDTFSIVPGEQVNVR